MKMRDIQEVAEFLPLKYIERTLHEDFFMHVRNKEEVSVLYGPRQVGKSVEIYKCMELLMKENPSVDIFYFSLDKITEDFKDPDAFLNLILARRQSAKGTAYVFIDEAQRLKNVGLFIKYIYDKKENIKFILTGSASLDIKEKIKEPLTGRKREFMLSPLSLKEVVSYHGVNHDNIHGRFGELDSILAEYLMYGGYPGVQALTLPQDKLLKLEEIADSYINRDIRDLFGIENIDEVRLVLSVLGESIGSLISIDNICNATGIKRARMKKLFQILESTFVIYKIKPFYKNKAKELIHHPKIYFYDLGLRNTILQRLTKISLINDKGKLFENMCAGELKGLYGLKSIKFWRNINQTEIDFIVNKDPDALRVYEAKYKWTEGKTAKNIQSFLNHYGHKVAESHVIHEGNFWEMW